MRLSHHGLRAKDNGFNAEFKTDFDGTMGNINIIPQDIGKVLLNLYNNAFYAVNEKVEIKVSNNDNVIPQKIVDKIFQPIFITKSTLEEKGLGLSLSYDIIKTHGGEIKVETKRGEGT